MILDHFVTMKTEFKLLVLVLFIGLILPSIIFGFDFYFKDHQEVQLHDRYFVFYPFEFGLVTIAPFMMGIFLVRGIKIKFKERWTNLFLCVGLILSTLVVIEIYELSQIP